MRDTRAGGRGAGSSRGRQSGYREAPRRAQAPASYGRGGAPYEYAQPPVKPRRPLPARAVAVLALVAVAVAAVVIVISVNAERNSYFSETVTAGVRINGADYSGWDADRLRNHLKSEFRKKIDAIQIKVTWQDRSWAFTAEDLGATENVDETVSRASMLARVGSLEQRRAEAAEIRKQGREFNVRIALDPEKLKAALLERTADVAHDGRNASVSFNPNVVQFDIPPPPYNIEDFRPTQEQIDAMFLVTPEQPGKTVDVDMMVQKIMDTLQQSSDVELELLVSDFVPQVTEATLREGFQLLNAYRTKLPSTRPEAKPRIDNIVLALSKFNGYILEPGEILSFNETTGERTEAAGYQPAPTIGGNKAIVDDFGGGVCQASTTLYNAAIMAGCEILDRGPHSFPSSYALEGFDAMVNWPNADLRFRNAGDGNLYIVCYVKKPWVYAMVFGKPIPGVAKITRESVEEYKGPPPPVEIREDKKGEYADKVYFTDDKPFVLVSGQPEMRYTSYLVYWDANGNVIEKKKLFEDRFREIKRVEILGTHVRETGGQSGSTAAPG